MNGSGVFSSPYDLSWSALGKGAWLNSTAVFGNLTYRTALGNEIGGEVRAEQGEARVEVPAANYTYGIALVR